MYSIGYNCFKDVYKILLLESVIGMFNRDYNQNPFIVIWELTRACQLHCLHCRAEAQHHRHPLELDFEEGKALIDQIYEMDNPMLVFTGGIPLRGKMYLIWRNTQSQKG